MWHKAAVITGKGRGKFLGYPTLNLVIPSDFSYPPGIYAGWVNLNDQIYQGAFHFGPIPTFDQPENALEVFVLDTDITVTPANLQFYLLENIRPPEKFATPQALIDQITLDVKKVRQVLAHQVPPTIA